MQNLSQIGKLNFFFPFQGVTEDPRCYWPVELGLTEDPRGYWPTGLGLTEDGTDAVMMQAQLVICYPLSDRDVNGRFVYCK